MFVSLNIHFKLVVWGCRLFSDVSLIMKHDETRLQAMADGPAEGVRVPEGASKQLTSTGNLVVKIPKRDLFCENHSPIL